jgi:uncharacterized protein YbjT (DUF2867 family)
MTTTQKPFVLAVGATGQFASLIVPELERKGVRVRGLVRDPAKAAYARSLGAAEVAVGDLRNGPSMAAALKGIDAVFYIAPAALPNEAEVGRAVVNAAREAGVRRFVFSSLIHPTLGELPHHSAKIPVEDAVLNSGMEFCFLHPTMFFQNFARSMPSVLETGVLAEPWSTDTRFTRVDYRDVAEVAAIALTEDRLVNGTFELCAQGDLNRRDVAILLGEVLGRPIRAEKSQVPRGSEPSPLQPMFEWYDAHGLLGNSLILRAILAREPRTLRAYFEELAQTTHGSLRVAHEKELQT